MHFILPIHKQTNILTISTFQFIFLQHQVLMTKPLPNLFIHSITIFFFPSIKSFLNFPSLTRTVIKPPGPSPLSSPVCSTGLIAFVCLNVHVHQTRTLVRYLPTLVSAPSTPPPSPSTPVVGVEKSRVSTRDLFFPFLGFL